MNDINLSDEEKNNHLEIPTYLMGVSNQHAVMKEVEPKTELFITGVQMISVLIAWTNVKH